MGARRISAEGTSVTDKTYKYWSQVAAYFDGDGCLSVRKVSGGIPFTIGLTIDFIDQSREQILMLESFMRRRGIDTGHPFQHGGAWRMSMGGIHPVKIVLHRMLPHLFKKSVEAAAALAYFNDKITGNEFQTILEGQVKEGNRERVGRRLDIPWTRRQGLKKATEYSTSIPRRRRILTSSEEDSLVEQYLKGSIGQRRLARSNGLSYAVVRRALARRGLATSPK